MSTEISDPKPTSLDRGAFIRGWSDGASGIIYDSTDDVTSHQIKGNQLGKEHGYQNREFIIEKWDEYCRSF